MSITRRHLLSRLSALSVAGCTLPMLPAAVEVQAKTPVTHLVSATGMSKDSYALTCYQDGATTSIHTGYRGHSCAVNPAHPNQVLFVGRRPSTQCLLMDIQQGRTLASWQSAPGYHLNGHAVYRQNGKQLFVCESSDHDGSGSLAVRDAITGQLITRWETHGLEPHEVKISPDGKHLIIANGGLIKNAQGQPQNIDTMKSSLVILDSQTGALKQQFDSPVGKASLRHIDLDSKGNIAIAAQAQVETNQPSPLAFLVQPHSQKISTLNAPDTLISHCKNYMGSVVISEKNNLACFTSPRGDLALFWDLSSQQLAGYHRFHDVCGASLDMHQEHFILSNSAGWLRYINAKNLTENKRLRVRTELNWDNHMSNPTALQMGTLRV